MIDGYYHPPIVGLDQTRAARVKWFRVRYAALKVRAKVCSSVGLFIKLKLYQAQAHIADLIERRLVGLTRGAIDILPQTEA